MAGNNAEMPFLDHLEELRWRLVWALGALAVGVAVAFWAVNVFDILVVLERPILPYLQGRSLIVTHPADTFRITISASLALGAIFALPVILYQVWAFLSPALYSHEKKVAIPVLIAATILFLCGAALSFFLVLPMTLRFLTGFQSAAFDPFISAREYFGFAISMSLALGVVFELPIAIFALTALGLVTPEFLRKFRRHALVLCLVVAAFITPGQDPLSLGALAGPLYILYEGSVATSVFVSRRRKRRKAAEAEADEAGATA